MGDPRFTDLTTSRANRVLHFALEVTVWAAFGVYGWHHWTGLAQGLLTFGLPLAVIVTWTAFTVPGDPWRAGGAEGHPPWVAIPGWLRLLYEVGVHGFALYALLERGWSRVALAFAIGFVVHYAVSWQRVRWLLRGR